MKINTDIHKGGVVLYKNRLEVRLEKDTVWLTQKNMADLFNIERSVITKHIGNIFKTNELNEKSNVQKMHIADSDKPVAFYNLDVIISVGYRVNSKQGTQFRMWATSVLRKHLVDGYTLNEKRLKRVEAKYRELQKVVTLIGNVAAVEGLSQEARGIAQVIAEYSRALDILDDFDHERLPKPPGIKKASFDLTYEEGRKIIDIMKGQFKASALMGQEKDEGFKSSIRTIYQTFDGKDLYPTVQEKAANLLYFVAKNHSFVDGNKRIAAALFVCFLQKNKILHRRDGSKRIDDNALVALTLMIAASKPSERELMIKVVLNLMVERPGI
ncbi:MAG: cytochrome C biogenesis protein CycH [Omnitrophica bacterium GWA2_52_12]|nr:MAG: cytochrome C biogenesis protein CycH [Omnitrophica bacterium GWA2_52_12]